MKIIIIGAGIAGLTTAIALKRIGLNSEIYESSIDSSQPGAGLGLAPNAIKAFAEIGLAEKIINAGYRFDAFDILDQNGKTISAGDSSYVVEKFGIDNFAIHRTALHNCLLESLGDTPIHYGKKAVTLNENNSSLTIGFSDNTLINADSLIAADGINSRIRSLLLPEVKPRYAGYTCWRGVVDAADLNLKRATETWGKNGRIGLVPLKDGQVYWFACLNALEYAGLERYDIDLIAKAFEDYHDPIKKVLMRSKGIELIKKNIYDIDPLKRFAFGSTLLIGDAAHATTPNMGQGACQGIEDAVILASEFSKNPNAQAAFKSFEKRRLEKTNYVIKQSRKIGEMAQISNPILISLRNWVIRMSPKGIQKKQFDRLYDFKA